MSDELITLATYRSAPKADLAKALLAESGIQAFVVEGMAVALGNAAGYAELRVPATQADAALALLNEHPQILDRGRPPADPDDGVVKCLACGTVMPDDVDRCQVCGWSYDDDGNEPPTSSATSTSS